MSAERLREMLVASTPGPWEPIFDPDDEERAWVLAIPDGHLYVTPLPSHNQDGLLDADARLIALAPDAIALLADMGETLTALRAQVGITKHADGDTSSMVIGAHSFDAAGVTEILQRLDALCGDDRA